MAKNKNSQKKQSDKAREQAEAREMEKRAEDARKSRLMGNIFLYAILAILAVFCLYTVLRTLFFTAPSVSELRTNYLFISLFAIPYLILTAAVVLRKLRKKARDGASPAVRRAEHLLFLAALIFAVFLFSYQMMKGRTDVSGHKACTGMQEALEQSGLPVRDAEETAETETQEIDGARTILERMSIERKLICGETAVTMNYHEGGSFVLSRFFRQAEESYGTGGEVQTESNGVAVSYWHEDGSGTWRRTAAICAHTDKAVLIFELEGTPEQVAALRPLLLEAAGKILGK